ncbi:hypothetical protein C5167_026967 [Papaver somniferum]|nr:hypothetical protein C5167_026967 [Papaver somniferum]
MCVLDFVSGISSVLTDIISKLHAASLCRQVPSVFMSGIRQTRERKKNCGCFFSLRGLCIAENNGDFELVVQDIILRVKAHLSLTLIGGKKTRSN